MTTPALPFVFDVHQHVGDRVPGWSPDQSGAPADSIGAEVSGRIAIMDRFGITQACVMPSHSYDRTDAVEAMRRVNDRVAAVKAAAPDRFPVAWGTVDLWTGAAARDEVIRCLEVLGLDGISWHHRLQAAYIDDARMHPLLELVAARRAMAMIHVFSESTFEMPWRLENLAEAHRNIEFVVGDGFSGYDHSCWMARLANHHPNLWFDTAALSGGAGALAMFVADAGDERLLLGTNCYGAMMTDFQPTAMDAIAASETLTEASKRRILGENARRLFGLP